MLAIQKRLTNTFFILLSLPATAMGFALSVQISALSWILSTKYGLEIHDVGLVWAAGPVAGIFGQVIIGVISDNVWFWKGRRRPFILIGGVLATLMLFALPNIDIISSSMGVAGILGVAITVALTLDLAINVSFNPTRSIIADVTPEGEKRTKGYTWMQTVSGTISVGAYVIGAIWNNYVLIYSGAILVFLLSVIPPFFIEEPRELENPAGDPEAAGRGKASLWRILLSIQPLWGFLLYAFYGMALKLGNIQKETYYVEYACLALTIFLIVHALMQREEGHSPADAGRIGFNKVLAAHSFTWVGIQTMFIYLFAFIQDKMPSLSDIEMGRVVSVSFLLLNAVAAILPALVLEPVTRKVGRVRTHMACIAIMAAGYAAIWAFGRSPVTLYLLMAVLGIGWAATVSLPFAIMSQKVDQAKMGLYMGLFNLSIVLPQLVASLGVGEAVSKAADKGLIFIICAVTLGASALFWWFVKEEPATEKSTAVSAGGSH